MKKESGKIDGYKWEVEVEECLGGWEQTYYRVEAPDGEEFCCNSTSGPLEDGVFYCMAAIENHKNGEYA